ncbi:MAG: EamA family transporter [Acidobacteriota bacterium]|nr:EamA family transporter [Acidobacteriota bacterium]
MTESERQHRFLIALNFGMVYVLWGSTYLAIRIVVEHIPPAVMGATRFLAGGVIMLAWCAVSGRNIKLTRLDFRRVATIGVLLLIGGNVGVAWAEKTVPSGLTALIVAVVPLWVAIIETFILKGERLLRRGVFGLLLGIVGLVILLWPKISAGALDRGILFGAGILMFASLSWATGSILSRRWDLKVDPFAATGWEMLIAGTVSLVIALALGDQHRVVWTARGIGAIAYLITAGSLFGLTAYIWLLNHVPTAKVATYAYVNPIVAVFLGWLILHEQVDGYILAGAIVIVGSVWLVNTSKVRKPVEAGKRAQPEIAACEGVAD